MIDRGGVILAAQLLHLLVDLFHFPLDRIGLGLPCHLLFGRRFDHVIFVRGGKVRLDSVIVALPDRVELMIVAARAGQRHAEQRRADRVGHLGQHFVSAAGHLLISRSCAAGRGD